MIFYHYTSEPHLEKIQEEGRIKVSESNVSATTEHSGPDVVWLFKEPLKGTTPNMLITQLKLKFGMLYLDKSKVQLQVNLPEHEVQRADKFFREYGADDLWIKGLEAIGQSKRKKWYVIQRDILKAEWGDITIRTEASDMVKDYNTGKTQRISHVEGTFLFGEK